MIDIIRIVRFEVLIIKWFQISDAFMIPVNRSLRQSCLFSGDAIIVSTILNSLATFSNVIVMTYSLQ